MESWCAGSQKINNRYTTGFTHPISDYVSKGTEVTRSKRYLNLHVHCNIPYSNKDMESTQMFLHGWMDK